MKFPLSDTIKKILLTSVMVSLMTTGLILCKSTPVMAKASTIAIIPFEINSQKDISFIRAGIAQMLKSRLKWKDHVSVVEEKGTPGKLNSQALLKTILNKEYALNSDDETAYDYVLSGSITEFAGAFSLDIKVFNIKNRTSRTFSEQAETMTKIIPEVDILAAKINKKIFNRTTAALKLSENYGKSIETKQNKRTRQNPEQFMIQQFGKQRKKAKHPFWKFWDRNDNKMENDNQEHISFRRIWQ